MRACTWALCACVAWLACAASATAAGRELRVLQADARTAFYVGIAAPPSAADVVRVFNRSLADISHTYLAGDYPLYLRNITLLPLYIELPEDERFVARVLERTCSALNGRRVAALLVCGGGTAAAAVVTAATRAGVPVLRASPSHLHLSYTIANVRYSSQYLGRERGTGVAADYGHLLPTSAPITTRRRLIRASESMMIGIISLSKLLEMLPLEIRLEITARETLHALRATLLHTHWHSFTLLAEEDIYITLSLRKDLSSILTAQPLNPKWLSLPIKFSRHVLFRRLAEISRLTRGVVVLICDVNYAKLVMDEAKRLNMLEGNFFWLWIDASNDVNIFHNISNRTQYAEDTYRDYESMWDNDEALVYERFDRTKRGDADNNTINDLKSPDTAMEADEIEKNATEDKINVKNSSMNSVYRRKSRDISTAESITDKLLSINFSQSYDSIRNISSGSVRNYNVNNKGVETSKIENNSIAKGMPLHDRDNSRRNSYRKMKNESFNKYVNSIHVDDVSVAKNLLFGRDYISSHDTREINNSLDISSDISDFLMNPKVHASTVHNLREKIEKRSEKNLKKDHVMDRKGNYNSKNNMTEIFNSLPVGLLALHPQPVIIDRAFVRAAVRLIVGALRRVLRACDAWSAQAQFLSDATASCWDEPSDAAADFSTEFVRETRISSAAALAGGTERPERSLTASFALLNLVPGPEGENMWRQVGRVLGRSVRLHTIVWPGGRLVAHGQSDGARTIFRIVTALAPPFVMEGELDEDGQCLRGLPCHRPQTSDRDNLTLAFNVLERESDQEAEDFFFPTPKPIFSKMDTHCCYGLAMDLLENIAQELEFDFHLYIVEDGLYGSRKLLKPFPKMFDYKRLFSESVLANSNNYKNSRSPYRSGYTSLDEEIDENTEMFDIDPDENFEKWNGIVGDLVSGAAHMSFAALSVSSARAEVIDYSQPYFFSAVSALSAPNQKPDIPLLAFLLPFSPELWIAIFTSLNVTAIAVAIYEWLSPFGLNPWGRQRSKNFSISSALWVMWGLLCGHLVAFKAPKSWPNKFLINVWGGFSVIFVASYTANIAALIAGLFFHNAVDDYQGRDNWLSLKVGTAKSSVAEYYIQRNYPALAQHMRRYALQDIEEGIQRLRNGTLDLLVADTPVLDYYRATDHGCKLQRINDHPLSDAYAIGMAKGFPLKESISAVIAKYSSNGYMDILTEKWYGGLPCFKLSPDYGIQPKPLGIAAVAGVFILLLVGVVVGCLILILEHLFYKYTLPVLRHQPKGTIWRSRNIMFFSQKLYRFINCVELVSPHHAARELVNTIRQGHFTSLFQKSVKRKEHEQRRRRKSKAQLYEMIQAIRKVQQRDHSLGSIKEQEPVENSEVSEEQTTESKFLSPSPDVSNRSPRQGRSPRQLRSPRSRRKRCSLAGLNVRRFSTDSVLGSDSVSNIYERTSHNIGRRLSRDVSCLTSSPPDINTRLRTPSPMVRRAEGSSTRSYQDVSDRSDNYLSTDCPTSRASVEILVSNDEQDLPPAPPYPRVPPIGARSELSLLSEDELIRLWRSSEREVREALLAALQERRANLDPKQDPG